MTFEQFIREHDEAGAFVDWVHVNRDETVATVHYDSCGCGCDESRFEVEYPIVDGFVIVDNNVKIPVK